MDIQKRLYLNLAVSIIVFLLIISLVIPFLLGKIKQASTDLLKKREAFESWQKRQQDYVSLNKDYQAIKPELEKVNQSFLESDKILDFIVALEDSAKRSNNKYEIKVIEQSTDAGGKNGLTTISFQVSLKGTFSNLLHFLVYLEGLPYFNEITLLQIQRASSVSTEQEIGKGDISANLHIKTYFNPAP